MNNQLLKKVVLATAVVATAFVTTSCNTKSDDSNRRRTSRTARGGSYGSDNHSDVYRRGLGQTNEIEIALEFYKNDKGYIGAEGTLAIARTTDWAGCTIPSGVYTVKTDDKGHGSVDWNQTVRGISAYAENGSDELEIVINYAMFTAPPGGNLLSCEGDEYEYAMLGQVTIVRSNYDNYDDDDDDRRNRYYRRNGECVTISGIYKSYGFSYLGGKYSCKN